ncbi:hypothetical protein BH10PLA2_BH10PLA2_09980 [soil metagenome]
MSSPRILVAAFAKNAGFLYPGKLSYRNDKPERCAGIPSKYITQPQARSPRSATEYPPHRGKSIGPRDKEFRRLM